MGGSCSLVGNDDVIDTAFSNLLATYAEQVPKPAFNVFLLRKKHTMLENNKANCRNFDFRNQKTLFRAVFSDGEYSGANFSSVDLTESLFNDSNCEKTVFRSADLSKVKFKRAILEQAELHGVIGLSAKQLSCAIFRNVSVDSDDKKTQHIILKATKYKLRDRMKNFLKLKPRGIG